MIAYDLQCVNGHTFEGWFEDRNAYLEQKRKRLIACPICNGASITRIPSSFGIKSSQPSKSKDISEHNAAIARISKEVIDFVDKNFDDVGCNFAQEALKMHYGASEPRNIRGVSTNEEEKILKDEGIQFFKIPMPAESDTDTQ